MVTLCCLVLQDWMGQATSFQPAGPSLQHLESPMMGQLNPIGMLGPTPERECLHAALWVCERSTSWDPHTVTHGLIPLLPELGQPTPSAEFSF